jgi:hypothetical protein
MTQDSSNSIILMKSHQMVKLDLIMDVMWVMKLDDDLRVMFDAENFFRFSGMERFQSVQSNRSPHSLSLKVVVHSQ